MCTVVFRLHVTFYCAGTKFHHMYYFVFQKYIRCISVLLVVKDCVLNLWTFYINYITTNKYLNTMLANSIHLNLWICRFFWAHATAGICKSPAILISLCICLSSFWHLIFFTLSQFLLPSLHATPHYQNSWYSLSLTLPFHRSLPLFLSLTLSAVLRSLHSRSHLIVSLFFSTHSCLFFSFCPTACVLRSTLLLWQTPCSYFPPGSETVFCHPIKALIYCIWQVGILVIYILPSLSVCASPSFSSLVFLSTISAGAKNRPAADSCDTKVKAVSIRKELVRQSID